MYRGFAIIENRWVYGYLFVAEDKKGRKQYQILQPDYFIGGHMMYVVYQDSTEEYTRLNDMYKKPIYEGDRIEFEQFKITDTPKKQHGTVEIWQGMACVKLENMEKVKMLPYIPLWELSNIRIIETHGKPEHEVNI